MAASARREHVIAWKPDVPGIDEVFHARFVDHVYPSHTHDTWTVLIVDRGAISFDLGRHHRGASGAEIAVLPPHVTHDGRSGANDGFRKRVLYLDVGLLGSDLIGRAVDRSTFVDTTLRRNISRLHDALANRDDALAGEALAAEVVDRLGEHLRGLPAATSPPAPPRQAGHDLRDLLDEHLTVPFSLARAAAILGYHPTHLTRSFTSEFGASPHAYVIGRRIDLARHRLLAGETPAAVAAAIGFHDQAHLHRHFRRHTGTTPGSYALAGRR